MTATVAAQTPATPATPARILLDRLGWQRADGPALHIAGLRGASVEPLALGGGRRVFLHQPGGGRALPRYAERRRIVRAVDRQEPGALVAFADPLRPGSVWSWVDAPAGMPPQYREREECPLLGEGLLPTRPELPAADGPVAARIVAAVGRRIDVRRPGRRRWRLNARRGAAAVRALQQRVERSDDPAVARAAWRAAAELGVLDLRCGTGDRLAVALAVLGAVRDAALERMRAWVADLERAPAQHRPEKLADFRRLLASPAGGCDAAARAHRLREILRDNLFGVEPDAHALRVCAERLLAIARTGAGPAAGVTLNLRLGNAQAGFGEAPDGSVVAAELLADAELVFRAQRLVRRLARTRAEAGAGGAAGREPPLLHALDALRVRLDAASARRHGSSPTDPAALRAWANEHRPVHVWLEFSGLVGAGGFDVVLGRRAAAAAGAGRGAPAAGPTEPGRSGAASVREGVERFAAAATPAARAAATSCHAMRLERGSPGYPARLARVFGDAPPDPLFVRGERRHLEAPLLAVFASVRTPAAVVLRSLGIARALAEAGIGTVGGFQSPLERELLDLLLQGPQPVVVAPARCIEPFRLPAAWDRAIAERRLLLVSPFDRRCTRPTTRSAGLRNRVAGALAAAVLIAHATPGGRLHALARELASNGIPLLTLDDPANGDLVRLGAEPVGDSDDCLAGVRTAFATVRRGAGNSKQAKPF